MICECCKFNGVTEIEKPKEYPIEFFCENCRAYCIRYTETEGCGFIKRGDVAVKII